MKANYEKFHKKVRATGIAMLCFVGATLIFLIVALGVYQNTSLPLIVGLPLFLSVDMTLLVLCYLLSRKDRDMRNELHNERRLEGASPLFAEIYRDYRASHLESVWDSVMPVGWKLGEVYTAEDKIEMTLTERDPAPDGILCEITLQFGDKEVTAFFDYGNEQDAVTKQLTTELFPDYPSLVIWLGEICRQFADKAASLKTPKNG